MSINEKLEPNRLDSLYEELEHPAKMKDKYKPGRILIVDDDEFNVWALSSLLNNLGKPIYDVAFNGRQAVEFVKGEEIRAMTSCSWTQRCPSWDGFETTKEILDFCQEIEMKPPIIVGLSGNSSPSFFEKCREAGMQSCLVKPIPEN